MLPFTVARPRATRMISANPSSDCAVLRLRFAWLCDSLADITRFISSTPTASARSAPRRLGTSAVYRVPGSLWMPPITSSASRRFGTALGETNEVTSIFASPVRESASISAIFSVVGMKRGSI